MAQAQTRRSGEGGRHGVTEGIVREPGCDARGYSSMLAVSPPQTS